ncbi:uncharacterized protein LOC129567764 [Sitodiplosis mosellana]|uniref:uncharacterized protein LOC129567764 n=1 Tax=Sitodiplosis mosellana TaxID=263140 RepID=UPI002444708F|nr:uncharacterized protein LOC129567764 [Sitodiplosis mosellana]
MENEFDSFENAKCTTEATKITELNTDCLEIIFEHLDFNDLIHVADSSKQFYGAVCQVYKRKYLNMNPILDIQYDPAYKYSKFLNQQVERDALEQNPLVFITKPIILLKLLRHFGHLIRNLGIGFSKLNMKLCVGIEIYLAKYCSDSLQRFSLICNTSKIAFKDLQKPLKKVIALKIHTVIDQKQNHIQFLNESNLPNVQHIYITNHDGLHNSEKEIHYENIESCTIESLRMDKFPFSFGNLKHFTLAGNICLNDAFCQCISKIEHLKTLKIMDMLIFDSDSFRKLLELQNILSSVVEMQFSFEKGMSADAVLHFLKQSRSVRKLTIHLHNGRYRGDKTRDYFRMLQTISLNLNDEWKVYIIDPYRYPFNSIYDSECHVIEKMNI